MMPGFDMSHSCCLGKGTSKMENGRAEGTSPVGGT